jgi:hypothetical protein
MTEKQRTPEERAARLREAAEKFGRGMALVGEVMRAVSGDTLIDAENGFTGEQEMDESALGQFMARRTPAELEDYGYALIILQEAVPMLREAIALHLSRRSDDTEPFPVLVRHDPVTPVAIAALATLLRENSNAVVNAQAAEYGGLSVNDLAMDFGTGRAADGSLVAWTKDRNRISVRTKAGVTILTVTRRVDPHAHPIAECAGHEEAAKAYPEMAAAGPVDQPEEPAGGPPESVEVSL